MSLYGLFQAAETIDADAVPSDRTSPEGVQTWAFAVGVPADTDGKYGAKGPTVATGGQALLTGTKGTTYLGGIVATAADGLTEVELGGTVAIPGTPPGTGTVTGQFNALTKGSSGNLPAGSVLTWQSAPTGAKGTFELSSPLSGALDGETTPSLLGRTLDRLQKPPKGGASHDYRSWCESVPGVYRAFEYPLRGGMCTVHTVVVGAGSGTGRRPADSVRLGVDAYVRTTRPLTVEGYQTLLPWMAPKGLALRLRLVPAGTRYRFDWSAEGGLFAVAGYTAAVAGNPPILNLTAPPPQSLLKALGTGKRPLVQIVAGGPSAGAMPLELACTSVAGSVLTLESGPDAGAGAGIFAVGDAVYPGGPLVKPAATAVLSHVDSLGPSRQSGLADENDWWEDTLSLARLIQVALELRDADEAPLCRNVLSDGVTIDGVRADRQADDSRLNAPELLYAGSIAITE